IANQYGLAALGTPNEVVDNKMNPMLVSHVFQCHVVYSIACNDTKINRQPPYPQGLKPRSLRRRDFGQSRGGEAGWKR
ncbi:MAG: hypothetical protein ACE5JP_03670, partial [Candidatus Bipolaricaulia bacterium]